MFALRRHGRYCDRSGYQHGLKIFSGCETPSKPHPKPPNHNPMLAAVEHPKSNNTARQQDKKTQFTLAPFNFLQSPKRPHDPPPRTTSTPHLDDGLLLQQPIRVNYSGAPTTTHGKTNPRRPLRLLVRGQLRTHQQSLGPRRRDIRVPMHLPRRRFALGHRLAHGVDVGRRAEQRQELSVCGEAVSKGKVD